MGKAKRVSGTRSPLSFRCSRPSGAVAPIEEPRPAERSRFALQTNRPECVRVGRRIRKTFTQIDRYPRANFSTFSVVRTNCDFRGPTRSRRCESARRGGRER